MKITEPRNGLFVCLFVCLSFFKFLVEPEYSESRQISSLSVLLTMWCEFVETHEGK